MIRTGDDRRLKSRGPEDLARRILYIQYTSPAAYPPLQHSSQILSRRGWRVLFLGVAGWGDAGSLRSAPQPNIESRSLPLGPPGLIRPFHYALYCLWVFAWALRWRPVWVYASDPASCLPALALRTLLGSRVVYHEHDSPERGASDGLSLRFCLATRHRLARRAELCVFPNHERATAFMGVVGPPTQHAIVLNCPLREEALAPRPMCDPDRLRLVYHGSFSPTRLPPAIIDALALLPDRISLQVVGYEPVGAAGHVESLLSRAAELGVADRVSFLGPRDRSPMLSLCRTGDIGLAVIAREGDVNERYMAGASNKPFEYLACGLAVLVSDTLSWQRMFVDPGYGLACDPNSPSSIAEALLWLYTHREETALMGEMGRAAVLDEWNYEHQFRDVLQLLEEVDR